MYFLNTAADVRQMLATIGVDSIEALFSAAIPAEFRLQRELDVPGPLGELELTRHVKGLAALNRGAESAPCFLGGGAYDHFIPAAVDVIGSRSEFYTSYTPYQPEVSQGNLQVMFEYQGLVTSLTGMDVSNASLYEGASAAAEAALLATAATGRKQVLVPATLHPEYRQTLSTLLQASDLELVTVAYAQGVLDLARLSAVISDRTAAILIQQPNFFGCYEAAEQVAQLAKQHGALTIAVVDPISLGLLKRPGDWGADIVVCEGQSLGNPLSFGGPYLGIMACKDDFVRRLPGRIAGQTLDQAGKRCWVLTLQTREQHIRREKATSNICTNQGLLALRASVYLACLGPHGMQQVAELSVRKAAYAAQAFRAQGRFSLAFERPFFKEFVLKDSRRQTHQLAELAAAHGLLASVPLGDWYPELEDCTLVAVTEKRSRGEIDQLVQAWSS